MFSTILTYFVRFNTTCTKLHSLFKFTFILTEYEHYFVRTSRRRHLGENLKWISASHRKTSFATPFFSLVFSLSLSFCLWFCESQQTEKGSKNTTEGEVVGRTMNTKLPKSHNVQALVFFYKSTCFTLRRWWGYTH